MPREIEMKNSFTILLLCAITFGAAAFLATLVPSLTVPMTFVSVGTAVLSTLILLFSLREARRQGRLGSALGSTVVMALITIALILWLLPRVPIAEPIPTPPVTPDGFQRG